LTVGTLAWRGMLKPFTTLLRQRDIKYRWPLVQALIVLKGEDKHVVYSLQGAGDLLPTLGLPQDAIPGPALRVNTSQQHRWDPKRAKTFVPRRPRQSPSEATGT
ncbi:Hypothetical predicted protein, partial [Pelobates cultripes]